jgi:hypothetical protein
MPKEELFRYSGPDWLLLILDKCSPAQRDATKLVLWRAWTVHNNNTHQSGSSLLSKSVFMLLNLRESCAQASLKGELVSSKGKEHCSDSDNRRSSD